MSKIFVTTCFPFSTDNNHSKVAEPTSRKNKRKQSAAEKDNNPTYEAGPSNKQRKPSGNEMDNKVVTLAKEGFESQCTIEGSRSEMALVVEEYKESKDRDSSFK